MLPWSRGAFRQVRISPITKLRAGGSAANMDWGELGQYDCGFPCPTVQEGGIRVSSGKKTWKGTKHSDLERNSI